MIHPSFSSNFRYLILRTRFRFRFFSRAIVHGRVVPTFVRRIRTMARVRVRRSSWTPSARVSRHASALSSSCYRFHVCIVGHACASSFACLSFPFLEGGFRVFLHVSYAFLGVSIAWIASCLFPTHVGNRMVRSSFRLASSYLFSDPISWSWHVRRCRDPRHVGRVLVVSSAPTPVVSCRVVSNPWIVFVRSLSCWVALGRTWRWRWRWRWWIRFDLRVGVFVLVVVVVFVPLFTRTWTWTVRWVVACVVGSSPSHPSMHASIRLRLPRLAFLPETSNTPHTHGVRLCVCPLHSPVHPPRIPGDRGGVEWSGVDRHTQLGCVGERQRER